MKELSAPGLAELAGVTVIEVARLVELGVLVPSWAVRSTRTYRQVSQETGVLLEVLGAVLEWTRFARAAPDEPMREDELAVVWCRCCSWAFPANLRPGRPADGRRPSAWWTSCRRPDSRGEVTRGDKAIS